MVPGSSATLSHSVLTCLNRCSASNALLVGPDRGIQGPAAHPKHRPDHMLQGIGSAWASGRLARELGVVQIGVQAVGLEQLGVRAVLDDPALVHHQDLVGLPDGRQPVRDHQ